MTIIYTKSAASSLKVATEMCGMSEAWLALGRSSCREKYEEDKGRTYHIYQDYPSCGLAGASAIRSSEF